VCVCVERRLGACPPMRPKNRLPHRLVPSFVDLSALGFCHPVHTTWLPNVTSTLAYKAHIRSAAPVSLVPPFPRSLSLVLPRPLSSRLRNAKQVQHRTQRRMAPLLVSLCSRQTIAPE